MELEKEETEVGEDEEEGWRNRNGEMESGK